MSRDPWVDAKLWRGEGTGLGFERGPRLVRQFGRYQYAPAFAVGVLFVFGVMGISDGRAALDVMWRPLLVISSIMLITDGAQRLGVLERIAAGLFTRARRSSTRLFLLAFCLSAGTATVLNNDSAVLLLVPIVVALARLRFPDRPRMVEAFAFVVFMAPGVAPFVVSNPMNLIVATYAGLNFNAYAAHMIPVAVSAWVVSYIMLRWVFHHDLVNDGAPAVKQARPPRWTAPQAQGLALLLAVMMAYPVVATLHWSPYVVAGPGAAAVVLLCWYHGAGPPVLVVRTGVAWDILVFLAGVSTMAVGLGRGGLFNWLTHWYHHTGTVGIAATSAAGSALINNHPMSLLNILAIGPHRNANFQPILAALVGGDLGPRLLPWGSLAGLLWFNSLQRLQIRVSVPRFIKVGMLVTLASLPVSLVVLAVMSSPRSSAPTVMQLPPQAPANRGLLVLVDKFPSVALSNVQ